MKFNLNSVIPFEDIQYYFIRRSNTSFDVYDISQESVYDMTLDDIREQNLEEHLNKFKQGRPEYFVGNELAYVEARPSQCQEMYDNLLLGSLLLRAFKNGWSSMDSNRANLDSLMNKAIRRALSILEWLSGTDFYTAPASTRFHDSHPGGLVSHCLNVYQECVELSKLSKFSKVSADSYTLCALTHDWVKINYYEPYMKNVRNDQGQWVQEQAYKYAANEPYPFGHGVASMYMVQQMIKLSMEECLAIRWHMGAWMVNNTESNELRSSNSNYPLVHMLQFADQLSIVNY